MIVINLSNVFLLNKNLVTFKVYNTKSLNIKSLIYSLKKILFKNLLYIFLRVI